MPHHAVGADQHQRADRILRGAQRGGRRHLEAEHVRALLQVVAQVALLGAVVAGERRDELAVLRLDLAAPARAAPVAGDLLALLVEALEEVAPLVADGAGVALVLRLHLLDVGRIGAAQKRGAQEPIIERLASHGNTCASRKDKRSMDAAGERPCRGWQSASSACALQHTSPSAFCHAQISLLGLARRRKRKAPALWPGLRVDHSARRREGAAPKASRTESDLRETHRLSWLSHSTF